MTDVRTPDAVEFLDRLLERSERNPDRSRPASAAPEYDRLSTAQQVSRFHDQMAAAERFGAVELLWGKRDRSHLIERVRVRDPELLARHLGRPPAPATAQRVRNELLPAATAGEPWVVGLLDEMTARWTRNEPAYRLAAGQADAAKEFFTLLASISRQEAKDWTREPSPKRRRTTRRRSIGTLRGSPPFSASRSGSPVQRRT
ncbi:DUF3322 domain-containing protein [Bradyrhizobium australiense]|uniref:DUF3322 domain-containing protein n=1 Tax=Bradyrhizobium australiense TaxID=2721161 RepID=UPI001F3A8AA8|nr:DUF3322 domain-containing protein [Bradyrhizobium australiense]